MMLPPRPEAYMRGRQARVVRKAPSRWIASSFFHSANGNSSSGWTIWMPALLTRMSTPPNASATAAMPASTAASLVTSIATLIAWTPRLRSSPATASAASLLRSAIATFAPAWLYASAMALPIPLAAPVTTATLSLSFIGSPFPGGAQAAARAPEKGPATRGLRGAGTLRLLRHPGTDQRDVDAAVGLKARDDFRALRARAVAGARHRLVLALARGLHALRGDADPDQIGLHRFRALFRKALVVLARADAVGVPDRLDRLGVDALDPRREIVQRRAARGPQRRLAEVEQHVGVEAQLLEHDGRRHGRRSRRGDDRRRLDRRCDGHGHELLIAAFGPRRRRRSKAGVPAQTVGAQRNVAAGVAEVAGFRDRGLRADGLLRDRVAREDEGERHSRGEPGGLLRDHGGHGVLVSMCSALPGFGLPAKAE